MELSRTGTFHLKSGKCMAHSSQIHSGESPRVADSKLPNRKECFCNYQFNVKACSIQGIYKTADVVKNDPSSLACKPSTVDVMSKKSSSQHLKTKTLTITLKSNK